MCRLTLALMLLQLWISPAFAQETAETSSTASPPTAPETPELSSRAQLQLRNAERLWQSRRFSEAAQLYLNLYEDELRVEFLLKAAEGRSNAGEKPEAYRLYQRLVDEAPNHESYSRSEARLQELRTELRGRFQRVTIESEPAGAYIYVDRKSGGTFGATPLTIELLPGSYMILAEQEGHLPQQKRLMVSDRGENTVDLRLLPLEEAGYLRFLIPHPRARVVIDGLFIGRSPLRRPIPLRAGLHQVEIRRSGYQPWTRELEVRVGDTQLVDVELIPDELIGEGGDEPTRLWPWVTMGTGGALLLAGLYTAFSAQSLYSKLEEKRDRGELIATSDIDTGDQLVTYTNLFLSVGFATVTGGVIWYLMDDGAPSQRSAEERLFMPSGLSFAPDGAPLFFFQGEF